MIGAIIQTLTRFFELTSLAFILAALVFRLQLFARPSSPAYYRNDILGSGLWRPLRIGLGVMLAAVLADQLMRAGGIQAAAWIAPQSVGGAWLMQVWLPAVLLLLTLFARARREPAWIPALMLGLAILAAAADSLVTHVRASRLSVLAELAGLLHLLAAGVWGGGILVLSLTILPALSKQQNLPAIADISRRFSRLAGYAAVFVMLTAFFQGRTYVGSFEDLWKTGYGRLVFVKMVLLYLLVLAGAFNRYFSVPVLQHAAGTRVEGPGLIGRMIGAVFASFRDYLSGPLVQVFSRALMVQFLIVVAIFFCSAALRNRTPPGAAASARIHRGTGSEDPVYATDAKGRVLKAETAHGGGRQ